MFFGCSELFVNNKMITTPQNILIKESKTLMRYIDDKYLGNSNTKKVYHVSYKLAILRHWRTILSDEIA